MAYTLQNFYKATVSLDWSIGTGNFYVSVKPTVNTGWVVISPNNATLREIVKFTATGTDANGDYITISVRGVGGTTEQTHSVGEPVRMNITAEYWDDMNTEIADIVASGAVNANTTTKGIVEEATAAEIDALTETGTTGAPLFINPKLLGDAKNIPHVAPGTSGNVMVSNGTDWVSGNPATSLPSPVFQQDLALSSNDSFTSTTPDFAAGSMTDGSAFFVRLQGASILYRFGRDAITGQYRETHSVTPSLTIPAGDNGAIINIGIYIYLFTNDATNIVCSRFLAADLTGEQVMTVPTVANTSFLGAWTDGTDAYVISINSQTTSRRWTVSGTTFTAASTATVVGSTFAENQNSTMWDGTTAYIARMDQSPSLVYKLTAIDATAFTSTTYIKPVYSDVQVGSFIVNIDATKVYIGFMYPSYDEAAQVSARIRLIPISKP